MKYDLSMVLEIGKEVGLAAEMRSPTEVALKLDAGAVLLFANLEQEDDCLVGFEGTRWHAHGDLHFSDRDGRFVDLGYLDVVTGLSDGTVLLCELWTGGELSDRWLVHRDCVGEFQYMEAGGEVRIRTVVSKVHAASAGEV